MNPCPLEEQPGLLTSRSSPDSAGPGYHIRRSDLAVSAFLHETILMASLGLVGNLILLFNRHINMEILAFRARRVQVDLKSSNLPPRCAPLPTVFSRMLRYPPPPHPYSIFSSRGPSLVSWPLPTLSPTRYTRMKLKARIHI